MQGPLYSRGNEADANDAGGANTTTPAGLEGWHGPAHHAKRCLHIDGEHFIKRCLIGMIKTEATQDARIVDQAVEASVMG
jgi:hypothetical protein